MHAQSRTQVADVNMCNTHRQTQIQPFIFNNSFSCFVVLLLCVRAIKQQHLQVEQKQMWTVFTKVKLALKCFEWGGQEPKEELNSSLCKLDSVQKLHCCSSKCPLDWWAYYIRPETKTNIEHRQSLIGCVFSAIQGHNRSKNHQTRASFSHIWLRSCKKTAVKTACAGVILLLSFAMFCIAFDDVRNLVD